MCEDIPCIKACPTNALDHGLTDINDADMGLAVVIDQKRLHRVSGSALRGLLQHLPDPR